LLPPSPPPAPPAAGKRPPVGAALLVAVEPPKRPPDGAVVVGAAVEEAGAAGFENRLPDGAALEVAGFENIDEVAGAVEAGAAGVVEAGVELEGVAADVPPPRLNNEPPVFGCSGALKPPNRLPPCAACDDAVVAGGAGVVDCDEAGVGFAKRLPPLAGGAGVVEPNRFDAPCDCPAPPNRLEVLGAAGVVEPKSDEPPCCPPVVNAAPPNKLDVPPVAGAFVVGGFAAGVVEPRPPKLKPCVFGAAGVVEGC
jgi:hypothetical protein